MKIKTAKKIAATHKSDKVVVIASRRTDMPTFYGDELINGLKQGVFHPQGMMQGVWEFQFSPSDIHSVGLWSQDFGKWLQRWEEIKNLPYKFWYRFSILPDDPVCKPVAPPVKEQLRQLEALVKIAGKEAVFLFIDPLITYRRLGEKIWHYNFSTESLDSILCKASSFGIENITTSIMDYYPKIQSRAEKKGIEFRFLDADKSSNQQEIFRMIQVFKNVADNYKMSIKTCCEKILHSSGLTLQGACVDGRSLNKIFGPGASLKVDSAQRRKYGCGCTAAVDIGRYVEKGEFSHHCYHHCLQCYARF